MLPLLLAASMLFAHGDTGRLELVETTPVDDTTVTYVVELTYEGDGDPVSDAEIIVVTDNVAPRAMDPLGDGRYEATIEFPGAGDYPLTFTVEEPTAELVVEQVVEATTTTATDAPAATTTSEVVERTRDDVAEEEGGAWWLLIVMGMFVAAMVIVAVAFVRGRASASNRPSR